MKRPRAVSFAHVCIQSLHPEVHRWWARYRWTCKTNKQPFNLADNYKKYHLVYACVVFRLNCVCLCRFQALQLRCCRRVPRSMDESWLLLARTVWIDWVSSQDNLPVSSSRTVWIIWHWIQHQLDFWITSYTRRSCTILQIMVGQSLRTLSCTRSNTWRWCKDLPMVSVNRLDKPSVYGCLYLLLETNMPSMISQNRIMLSTPSTVSWPSMAALSGHISSHLVLSNVLLQSIHSIIFPARKSILQVHESICTHALCMQNDNMEGEWKLVMAIMAMVMYSWNDRYHG